MKKVVAFLLILLVFGFFGYYIGASQNTHIPVTTPEKQEIVEDFKDVYRKGWFAWCSNGDGSDSENAQYIYHWIFGRNFGEVFTNSKDAFFAGYRDGFYFVNKHELDNSCYAEEIEKAYEVWIN